MTEYQKNCADLILKNATIWTVDGNFPRAEAVAIKGNEIIAVGRDEEMDCLIDADTKVFDLEGKLVLPGFNDSHTHYIQYTLIVTTGLDLYQVNSLGEIQRRIIANARDYPGSDWIYGVRWFPNFKSGKWPSRIDLDKAENKRPVAIYDIDFHTAWVNTPALERLGYDTNTINPEGGIILREESGYPTGILFEKAYDPIPSPPRSNHEALAEWFSKKVTDLNKLGVTSIGNMEPLLENIEFTSLLAENQKLNLRINHWTMLTDGIENAKEARELCRDSEKVTAVSVKAFMDGVFSNRSAWLLEPYLDNPNGFGYPVITPDELAEKVVQADKEGFQVITHAIGDRAVREVLNIYERAALVNDKRDRRHRIEHIELVHPTDINRFASLNVVASMMPVHKCTLQTKDYMPLILDQGRAEYSCAWQKFVTSGAHVSFGSDWPCIDMMEPDPLKQIYAVVTGIPPQTVGGSPIANRENCLTIEQAIRCYTLEGAYAEYMEKRKGSITAGKLADLCVLSQNILELDPSRVFDTKVLMTVFDGRIVFDEL